MGCDSQFLKNFWMGRKKLLTKPIAGGRINRLSLETTTKKNKKLLTKPIAGDKVNRLSLETTTKKNKKVVDKDKCF